MRVPLGNDGDDLTEKLNTSLWPAGRGEGIGIGERAGNVENVSLERVQKHLNQSVVFGLPGGVTDVDDDVPEDDEVGVEGQVRAEDLGHGRGKVLHGGTGKDKQDVEMVMHVVTNRIPCRDRRRNTEQDAERGLHAWSMD